MLRLYQQRLASLVNDPNGMITVDELDFPKKGRRSVGVSRQHCGVLGKTDNCQAGVFIGYSGSKGYGLVDRRLYLPKVWFDLRVPEFAHPLRRSRRGNLCHQTPAGGRNDQPGRGGFPGPVDRVC